MEAEPREAKRAGSEKPLAGRRILVPESRELDLFARMLEERGAEAVRCPLVTIRDVEDPAPVEAWLQRLAAGAFDDLILLTGEGLRRLVERCAARGDRGTNRRGGETVAHHHARAETRACAARIRASRRG